MNRKQRDQNRANARRLEYNAVICPECGEKKPEPRVSSGLVADW